MIKCFLFNAFLLIAISSFSQKQFLNPQYKLQKQPVKIALLPIFQKDKAYTEAIANNLIKDSLSSLTLASPDITNQSIITDTMTNASVKKILNKEFTNEELKNNPNLSLFLTAHEASDLKKRFDNADLLLVPLSISVKTVTKLSGKGNATVYERFLLYDLNSGDLIFDFPAKTR